MAAAVSLRQEAVFADHEPASARDEILARYRHLRAISRVHNTGALGLVPTDAILRQARRLGLAHGRTLILDDMNEMTYAMDLAVYTASPDRTRALERYARSVQFAKGSDEALMLAAMRNDRFAVAIVRRRHEAAGLILTDVARNAEIWLMDEGLEHSFPDGAAIATRYYTPDRFAMTAGVVVPLGKELLATLLNALPHGVRRKSELEALQDRRFAETLYRVALETRVTDGIRYQNWGDADED
jgi:hypothetical protein